MDALKTFADLSLVDKAAARIAEATRGRGELRFMEVCGTHTMAIHRHGLPSRLPPNVRLLSGPGCPVCVTPVGFIDVAVELSHRPNTVVATFGDLMRVPGSNSNLEKERGAGAKIKTVYSAMDAVALARNEKDARVVMLGIGFETTAPTLAAAILHARDAGIANFSLLSAAKVVPPVLRSLLSDSTLRLDGLILPGHVSAIIGTEPYLFIPREFGVPCVVAGFEPVDIMTAVMRLAEMRVTGQAKVEVGYSRVVPPEGNPAARVVMQTVFEEVGSSWRGFGMIPASGLAIREALKQFDALSQFDLSGMSPGVDHPGCRCGEVLRASITPPECPLFGNRCVPENPVGACMISSEGTCAAYYKYGAPHAIAR